LWFILVCSLLRKKYQKSKSKKKKDWTKKIKEKLFSGSSTVQFAIDVLNGKVSTD